MTAEHARIRAHQGHVAEKATIDHLVRALSETPPADEGRVLAAVTDSGLVVEDQVRKIWDRTIIGLAIF